MTSDDGWITIPNWEKFQHYRYRRPLWIRNYTTLLHKPEYLELSLAERGLLHTTWLAYADNNGQLRKGEVEAKWSKSAYWESLNHAGFVVVSASKSASVTLKQDRNVSQGEPEADTIEYVTLDQIKAYAASL